VDYDMIVLSFYPLWHGKSLTEGRTKIQAWSSAYHQRTVAKRPILLRWIGTIGPTTWSSSPIKGLASTTASFWENQALFDFDNMAVPALREHGLNEVKKLPIHLELHFPSKTFVVGLEPI
jgi:arabinogalactan endo-1,4-beta-galactosidase